MKNYPTLTVGLTWTDECADGGKQPFEKSLELLLTNRGLLLLGGLGDLGDETLVLHDEVLELMLGLARSVDLPLQGFAESLEGPLALGMGECERFLDVNLRRTEDRIETP